MSPPESAASAVGEVVGTAARTGLAWWRAGFVGALLVLALIAALGGLGNGGGQYEPNVSPRVITSGDGVVGNPCAPWGRIADVSGLGSNLYQVTCDDPSGLGAGVTLEVSR